MDTTTPARLTRVGINRTLGRDGDRITTFAGYGIRIKQR